MVHRVETDTFRDNHRRLSAVVRRLWWPWWLGTLLLLSACGDQPWNDPYPAQETQQNILYSAFDERPKSLDPARSYNANEAVFTEQVYESPLQYHFLKRPYQLIPSAAVRVPQPYYLDAEERRLSADAADDAVAYSVYEVEIKPGIRYQPHPAFAEDDAGQPLYLHLSAADLAHRHELRDFEQVGSRELVAADFVYQLKRLAHPRLHSPIFGLMSEYIVGLNDYAATLATAYQAQQQQQPEPVYLDLRQYPLPGVQVLDRYRYRIKIHGKYPQLLYWLAMPFFAPMPPEADRFFTQPGMEERNISLDWYPVGTGPYMLTINNPNRQMVLERNPNFRGDRYPSEGEVGDREMGYLDDAGKAIPFIDKAVYSLEKETIPYWNKFLQGYYDASNISSDSFDQAIQVGGEGEVSLSEEMKQQGIGLRTAVATSIFFMCFNMLDPVVGGNSEPARKLRHALSIAVDYEEFISIFLNGRGIAAQSILPPGIFGYRDGEQGVNPYVYDWTPQGPKRKTLAEARRLLAEAGYPNGRDAKTGKPLVLYFDTTGGGPGAKARIDWWRKQFAKLDVQLVVRSSDYNRFQDKVRKGTAQLFQWGWNADYPDPENFLFLLYGENGKVEKNGENMANYRNAEFDRLFVKMTDMPNGPERQAVIDAMIEEARYDAPWLWGFLPKNFSLYHGWYKNAKPNLMARNTLKYKRVDVAQRAEQRALWNKPLRWPLLVLALVLLAVVIPALLSYRRHERMSALEVKR